jgi:hypothetical protein
VPHERISGLSAYHFPDSAFVRYWMDLAQHGRKTQDIGKRRLVTSRLQRVTFERRVRFDEIPECDKLKFTRI